MSCWIMKRSLWISRMDQLWLPMWHHRKQWENRKSTRPLALLSRNVSIHLNYRQIVWGRCLSGMRNFSRNTLIWPQLGSQTSREGNSYTTLLKAASESINQCQRSMKILRTASQNVIISSMTICQTEAMRQCTRSSYLKVRDSRSKDQQAQKDLGPLSCQKYRTRRLYW